MKVLMLADINSAHTQKWVRGLSARGITVGLFSLSIVRDEWYKDLNLVHVFYLPEKNSTGMLSIISLTPQLRSVLRSFKPDVLHAHYASSYGLLGALSGFRPYVISAWGSDVMEFPKRSFIHHAILRYNLKKADLLLATSTTISDAISEVSSTRTSVLPFGIDTDMFSPGARHGNQVVIGTVKSMEAIYGIDVLIKAFAEICRETGRSDLSLLLAGGGSRLDEYKELADSLGIAHLVTFTGKLAYEAVPAIHRKIDIFVNVSRNESFGVSVLESSASSVPVIVSNVGGLPAVVKEGITGLIVKKENVAELKVALLRLIADPQLRQTMGEAGRQHVKSNYDFRINLEQQIAVYKNLSGIVK